MIVLDTNVVSELMRPAPSPDVLNWLNSQVPSTLFLTTVVMAEVRFGIQAMPDGKRKRGLHERFEDGLLPAFQGRVLPFDEDASVEYARIGAAMRRLGLAIGRFDALIAAIAAAHRFAVATRDTAPFEAAGLSAGRTPQRRRRSHRR